MYQEFLRTHSVGLNNFFIVVKKYSKTNTKNNKKMFFFIWHGWELYFSKYCLKKSYTTKYEDEKHRKAELLLQCMKLGFNIEKYCEMTQ